MNSPSKQVYRLIDEPFATDSLATVDFPTGDHMKTLLEWDRLKFCRFYQLSDLKTAESTEVCQ